MITGRPRVRVELRRAQPLAQEPLARYALQLGIVVVVTRASTATNPGPSIDRASRSTPSASGRLARTRGHLTADRVGFDRGRQS